MSDGQEMRKVNAFSMSAEPANEFNLMVSKGFPEAPLSTSEPPLNNLGRRSRRASMCRRHPSSADDGYLSRNRGVVKGGAALSPRSRT